MTSTQEPNTMVPQSALCICLRKWKAKLIVPIYFATKEFCLRIISSSLESELSLDSKDSEIHFDKAHFRLLLQIEEHRMRHQNGISFMAQFKTSCCIIFKF